jgi:translin
MTHIKIQDLLEKLTKYFNGKEQVREKTLKLSREISKNSTTIIRKIHKQSTSDLPELQNDLKTINKKYKDLKAYMSSYPEVYHSNMVENYIQEYAEAIIMLDLIKSNFKITKLPDPDKLGIPYTTYLLGLGDVIGEFRRCTLDALRRRELPSAIRYLEAMEQLYEVIIDLNYPDKVLPLRRKQDVARALIEKTRSELAFAVSEYGLVENITELKTDLDRYYKNVVRKN